MNAAASFVREADFQVAGEAETGDALTAFLAYLNQEGLANIGHSFNQTFGTSLDIPLYQFGIYGAIIVLVMLIRPQGLIPSARRAAEFHEGVADTPLYDVTHEGSDTDRNPSND